jgi:hypothetical protein
MRISNWYGTNQFPVYLPRAFGSSQQPDYVGFARWGYHRRHFPLYQIVWPNADGHYPGAPTPPGTSKNGNPCSARFRRRPKRWMEEGEEFPSAGWRIPGVDPLSPLVTGCYRAGQISLISASDPSFRPNSRRTSGNPVGGRSKSTRRERRLPWSEHGVPRPHSSTEDQPTCAVRDH